MGRVGSADRAGGLRPEPASPSRPEALIPSRNFNQGETNVHETTSASAQRPNRLTNLQAPDASRLSGVMVRLTECQGLACDISVGLGAELDRLLGATPQGVDGGPEKACRPNGAVSALDEQASDLARLLDHIRSQTQRLSSI